MTVLVTGGTGYIGSHTVVELLTHGQEVVILDNLSNSKRQVLDRIRRICDRQPAFCEADLRDADAVAAVFEAYDIETVIHFAAFKAVNESVQVPLRYYENNLVSTLRLCTIMQSYGVFNLIFSSTCAVYGDPTQLPLTERSPTGNTTNPYARSKHMLEQMLGDMAVADPRWSIVLLRYFNPIGAHESGLIGEDPLGIPNNLLPFIAQVATGRLPILHVFGADYPTRDGTCIRDYIHVVDLSRGHLAALKRVASRRGIAHYNLGVGAGYTVLEVIQAFEKACSVKIPFKVVGRRDGDVPAIFSDCSLAQRELGWEAKHTIDEMCRDAWRWQSQGAVGHSE